MDFAREKGLSEIEGLVLTHNPTMLKLMRGLGFHHDRRNPQAAGPARG
jgi:hypothetical protein